MNIIDPRAATMLAQARQEELRRLAGHRRSAGSSDPGTGTPRQPSLRLRLGFALISLGSQLLEPAR